jgi:rhamnopyranosyl-N-acetylglucosaminyl-diphospho-decaprenol beta-1,3/1,4-galactofuranosyltransferase
MRAARQTPPPLVVAIVVTHNRPDELSRCLTALQAQTIPPTNTVVIDNASAIATQVLLATYPDVLVYRLPTNLGGAGGFATGLKVARSFAPKWYWLMDDDCLPDPDALRNMLDTHRQAESANIAGIAPAVHWSNGDVMCGALRDGTAPSSHADWAPFAGLLLRRTACDAVGGIRGDFFIWNDDREYGLRLRRAGWHLLCSPEAIVRHPSGGERFSRRFAGRTLEMPNLPPWKEYYGVRNGVIVSILDAPTRATAVAARLGAVRREMNQCLHLLIVVPRPYRRILYRLRGLVDGLWGRAGRIVDPP